MKFIYVLMKVFSCVGRGIKFEFGNLELGNE
jgi:hypothetical protein